MPLISFIGSLGVTDGLTIAIASFVAVSILARMMLHYRERQLREVRKQVRRETRRLARIAEEAEKARVQAAAIADYRRAAEESRKRAMAHVDEDTDQQEEELRKQINASLAGKGAEGN